MVPRDERHSVDPEMRLRPSAAAEPDPGAGRARSTSRGRPRRCDLLRRSGQGQNHRDLRTRQGSDDRHARRRRFFRPHLPDRPTLRAATAISLTESTLIRFYKAAMLRVLDAIGVCRDVHPPPPGAKEPDRGRPCGSSAQFERKALAPHSPAACEFRQEWKAGTDPARITQEMLAEMVGTTRPRVSFFMNRFRKRGFVDYKGRWKAGGAQPPGSAYSCRDRRPGRRYFSAMDGPKLNITGPRLSSRQRYPKAAVEQERGRSGLGQSSTNQVTDQRLRLLIPPRRLATTDTERTPGPSPDARKK